MKMQQITSTLLRKWKVDAKSLKKKEKKRTLELRTFSKRTDGSSSNKEDQQNSNTNTQTTSRTGLLGADSTLGERRDSTTDDDTDGYENDDCVAAIKNNISPTLITTPPPIEINQPPDAQFRKDRASTKGHRDAWDDDFAFIDPKNLVSNTSMVHSHSATNLNSYHMGGSPLGSASSRYQAGRASQLKRRQSTGTRQTKRHDTEAIEVYSYVDAEVKWALGQNRQPAKEPKLDSSSDEEEIEQPLYQNERVSIDALLSNNPT